MSWHTQGQKVLALSCRRAREWCRDRELNPDELALTAPSKQRVYHFTTSARALDLTGIARGERLVLGDRWGRGERACPGRPVRPK